MPSSSVLSPDECIATINRSNIKVHLVPEGKSDAIVFRSLEKNFPNLEFSLLPVGGRSNVLRVFERRNEVSIEKKVVFVADRDFWVHTGVPGQYLNQVLILTHGYSIENDLVVDGEFESYIYNIDKDSYRTELEEFLGWHALAVWRTKNGNTRCISFDPVHILSDSALYSKETQLDVHEKYPTDFLNRLRNSYRLLTRGKSLLALIVKHLSYKERDVRFRSDNLIGLAAARGGPLTNRLKLRIAEAADLRRDAERA